MRHRHNRERFTGFGIYGLDFTCVIGPPHWWRLPVFVASQPGRENGHRLCAI